MTLPGLLACLLVHSLVQSLTLCSQDAQNIYITLKDIDSNFSRTSCHIYEKLYRIFKTCFSPITGKSILSITFILRKKWKTFGLNYPNSRLPKRHLSNLKSFQQGIKHILHTISWIYVHFAICSSSRWGMFYW